MKRLIAALALSLFLPLGVWDNVASGSTVDVRPTAVKPKKYKNCTELKRVYPRGVAKFSSGARRTGAKFSATLYNLNKHLDRDKDFIACERSGL